MSRTVWLWPCVFFGKLCLSPFFARCPASQGSDDRQRPTFLRPFITGLLMQPFQREFMDFMIRSEVLTFGAFTTKSGRKTPFFINTGKYRTGDQLNQLAGFYCDAILEHDVQFDVLFGPAYKGIPLVVAVAMEFSRRGRNYPFCFNRKEAKDHGEGGALVGHVPGTGERVLIVEDVTTAGTSIRETIPLLRAVAGVELAGLVVSVDRRERGQGDLNALAELRQEFCMPAIAITNIDQIADYLRNREIDGRVVVTEDLYAQIRQYRLAYGGRE